MSKIDRLLRPKSLTADMKRRAATGLVEILIRAGLVEETEKEDAILSIEKVAQLHMDGYELMRELETYCYGWDGNLLLADELDQFHYLASEEIEQAQKEWAQKNNIEPPFSIGTKVKCGDGETGIITEIYSHGIAQFCVAIDGDPNAAPPTNCRRIINFEDAEAQP